MKPLVLTTLAVGMFLTACSNSEPEKKQVDAKAYQVSNAAELQTRFDQLNTQLKTNFKQFKQVESIAFAHQNPLDVTDLKTLNMHLVASTALKPTKVAYCDLMNGYFSEMYRLGHYNLKLVKNIKLPKAEKENLEQNFASKDQFYDFIMNRYTTYRQVQQIMGYGCNLKENIE
jgi:hypothetical protein